MLALYPLIVPAHRSFGGRLNGLALDLRIASLAPLSGLRPSLRTPTDAPTHQSRTRTTPPPFPPVVPGTTVPSWCLAPEARDDVVYCGGGVAENADNSTEQNEVPGTRTPLWCQVPNSEGSM